MSERLGFLHKLTLPEAYFFNQAENVQYVLALFFKTQIEPKVWAVEDNG